jgi:hypothetical protein
MPTLASRIERIFGVGVDAAASAEAAGLIGLGSPVRFVIRC